MIRLRTKLYRHLRNKSTANDISARMDDSRTQRLAVTRPFFDEHYYLSQLSVDDIGGDDALEHYFRLGYRQNVNPNSWLDGQYYLTQNKDVDDSGMSPLEHFILYGFSERRLPHENADRDNFDFNDITKLKVHAERSPIEAKPNNSDSIRDDINLISDSGLFDIDWVVQQNPDLIGLNPIEHYCVWGYKEGRNPNRYFDTQWYMSTHKVVVNPLVHYITKGWKLGFNPSYNFDARKYSKEYIPTSNDVNPLLFHFQEGAAKGFQAIRCDYGRHDCRTILDSGLFDYEWMRLKYPDLKGHDPLLHFCVFGFKERRLPNPFFDTEWYAQQYLDQSETNPLVHYIESGKYDNLSTAPNFNARKYLNTYPETVASGKDALTYYLTEGRAKRHRPLPCSVTSHVPIEVGASIAQVANKEIASLFEWSERPLEPDNNSYDPSRLNVHFVIPDFGVGGGGHMNIFRLIRWLEYFGHRVAIWIMNPHRHKTSDAAYEGIVRHYFTVKAAVHLLEGDGSLADAQGDIIFATAWNTMWPVLSASRFKRRFYLVQDYEPYFHAKGARSELARHTYTQDVDCICAGQWLNEIMSSQYGQWSRYFNLAADRSIFYPEERDKDDIFKVVLYARRATERRAVELALVALELMAKEGISIHVDMFGVDFSVESAPYSCSLHVTRTPEQLAKLYRRADAGIVFSVTNYSLVPQEMMACGLPVIEFDGQSARSVYPEGVVSFAGPLPHDIKNTISELLDNNEKRATQSEMALHWVSQFSWEGAAQTVERALLERLDELGFERAKSNNNCPQGQPKASVVIPACNGGDIFKRVLEAVLEQRVPWPFEVIVLDSESDDGTVDVIKSHKEVVYQTVARSEFSHGGTRNYGVEIAQGEFVAFLTHDALPLNEFWLYDLVSTLERLPRAAGVFGKHTAHDDASFYTRRELEAHFGGFDEQPLVVSKDTPVPNNMTLQEWRQRLHFYSDNNSCLKKSVWEQIPYPHVQYGEDQLWADAVITHGFEIAYSPTAVVKHSHDYTADEVYERAKTDADFFKYHWGYCIVDESHAGEIISSIINDDTLVGLENGVSASEIERRHSVVRSRILGYVAGQQKNISLFDEKSSERTKF